MIMYSVAHVVVDTAPFGGGRAELRRAASLAARGMLGRLLQESTGIPAQEWRIGKDARGKPMAVAAAGEHVVPEVSISHSYGWAAAAVSTLGPIGIDVDCPRSGRNISGIAEASFGQAERSEVASGGADAFYRIWTLREAMAKADGADLSFVVDGRDLVSGMPTVGTRAATLNGRRWLLMHIGPDSGVHLALAVAASVGLDGWPQGLPVFVEPIETYGASELPWCTPHRNAQPPWRRPLRSSRPWLGRSGGPSCADEPWAFPSKR